MIQANELRIGNVVYGVSDRLEKVIGIQNENIVSTSLLKLDSYFESEIKFLSPVEISEQILLKCGFENTHGLFTKEDLTPIYLRKPFIEADFYHVKTISGDKLTSIKYVHQLQNFYHSITGQELNIDLL